MSHSHLAAPLLTGCTNCVESDTPIKPPAAAHKPNNDNDAELQAELQQLRALVAGGPSTDRTPKDKPSSKHQNADLTFGNDESPTPLRIPKRKRKHRGNDDDDDDDDERTDSTSNDGKKIKHKRSLIGNMKPVPRRQAESFIDDEADDLGDSDGDSEGDHSDDAEFDDDNDDGEGVSLNVLKKQILGRKLVTTPATPYSNHKEIYLQSEKVMMAPVPTGNGASAVDSPMVNGLTTRYAVPDELRKELNCPICHETLYQPVSLTCGHSFCEECLGWWLQRNQIPRGQRIDADAANYGSCPTCRAPLACDGRELSVNTSLRACIAALLGDELTDRVLEERKKRLAATRGERGGAHDKGYEVITPADEGGWVKLGYKLTFRRSTVLDANDQRMQLSMSLWGGPSGDEPLRFDGQRLDMSVCLLSMEEDEVGAGGFPRMIRDEDDEHLICNENRFISTSIVAMAKNDNSSKVQVGVAEIDEDGVAKFSLDVTVGACRRAQSILFCHDETGTVFEVKIPHDSGHEDERDSNAYEAQYSSKARSYLRNDSDNSDHDSENEYEADDFVVMDEDEFEEEEADAHGREEDEDEDNVCCMCREHGELMICDGGDHLAGCGRSFHVACVDREEVPDGDWVCKRCANAFELDVGVEGYEFPAEVQAGGARVVGRQSFGGTIDLNDSSSDDDDDEAPQKRDTSSGEQKKSNAKRRHVLEDSDDED